MKLVRLLLWGTALLGGAALATSCGRATSHGGDSNTHWLQDCNEDADCGPLSCLCGICSQACAGPDDCRGLGDATACAVPESCEGAGQAACVAAEASSGGSASRGGSGGVSGPAPGVCQAQDAHDGPSNCSTVVGYAWNGRICRPIRCSCQGSDCAQIFPSSNECDRAYSECYAASGVLRQCSKHEDCQLQQRTCCPSCSGLEADFVISVHMDTPGIGSAGLKVCLGDPEEQCPANCFTQWNHALYPACIEGQCAVLDVSEHANCETDDDCHLTTKDCCECGGDISLTGTISVDASFTAHDHCAGVSCDPCVPPERVDSASLCYLDSGKCGVYGL